MRVVCLHDIADELVVGESQVDNFTGKEGTIVWVLQPDDDDDESFYEICVVFDEPSGIRDALWHCDHRVPSGNGRYGFASSVEPLVSQQVHEQPITMSIDSLL